MKKRLTVNVDEKLVEPLKINAIKNSTTVGEIVERLIADYLKVQPENEK